MQQVFLFYDPIALSMMSSSRITYRDFPISWSIGKAAATSRLEACCRLMKS